MNRAYNATNPAQGRYKRVLCVCAAGLLRSPTAAVILSAAPYCYNTRAAGLDTSHALIPVDDVLVGWADEIVCMEHADRNHIEAFWPGAEVKCVVLGIEDRYNYRDEVLIRRITEAYDQYLRGAGGIREGHIT